jgi:hypothetical protein
MFWGPWHVMKWGNYNASQTAAARVIVEVFDAAGLPDCITAAALANAYAESALNPAAVGDGGKSIGLFQLHERGAGSGMSVAERKDPRINAKTIIDREVNQPAGARLRRAAAAGASVAKLTVIFAEDLERPFDLSARATPEAHAREAARREAIAVRMFGESARRPGFFTGLPPELRA